MDINRDLSLDALRGIAILGMVLSGSIAYSPMMTKWMFHAQVAPPTFKFDPSIYGITWVDLVFPFFLFAMGAAIPLSIHKIIGKPKEKLLVLQTALQRFVLISFFAIFSQQIKSWVLAENPSTIHHLLSILGFLLLCIVFMNFKTRYSALMRWLGVITGLCFIYFYYNHFSTFTLYKSDIILLVLANMAFFGTLIYYSTINKPILRLGILPFIFAFFATGNETHESWVKIIFEFNEIVGLKIDWMYKFYFLKYLFIIIPGTFAGEWLRNGAKEVISENNKVTHLLLPLTLIITNLVFLFERYLFVNFICSVVLCLILIQSINKTGSSFLKKCVDAGTYCLLLGLCLEAYEGGIRKDGSTYSYYFVTSGLAFFSLIIFKMADFFTIGRRFTNFLAMNGQNPMVAYVAGSLLILPIFNLSGLNVYWDQMNFNFFVGLMKGIIYTALVSYITIFFVRKGWFWKT